MALAGGILLPWMPALEAVNLDHPYNRILPLSFQKEFSLHYEHSIYGSTVRECYRLRGQAILLVAVETSDPGVAAYYGLDAQGPHYQVSRSLPELVLRVRMSSGGQLLLIGGLEVQVREMGLPGDRILLKPSRCSLLKHLKERCFL